MSDDPSETGTQDTDPPATGADDLAAEVDKWKSLSKKNEARAKENATAAKRLREIEEAGKSEAQKAADRVAQAEAEMASVPAKVAEGLRDSLVELGLVTEEDKVLLSASDPETLLAQVKRLGMRGVESKKNGNRAPLQGRTTNQTGKDEPLREFTRTLFKAG